MIDSGTSSIIKEGEGELIMQNRKKTYSGGTIVKGGTLAVKGSNTVGTGAITVKDGATLEIASGVTLSNAVTLEAGSALALTATSSTFTALTNAVTLPTGENEKVTIRIDGQRLKSGDHTILSNVAAGATDNVTLDMTSAALEGRKATLKVEDGNLVLNIIATPGLMLIVK